MRKPYVFAAIFAVTFSGAARADEEMDQVIDAARPFMHHSCASVIEVFGEDEDTVAEIVRLMAMISLYNRQIDVMARVPDEGDQELLKTEFVEELEDACDDDPGRLLAGAVDQAVRDTMDAFD